MSFRRRPHRARCIAVFSAALAALGGAAAAVELTPASASSINQLSSQLSHQQARQQSLSSSIGGLSKLIGSLDGQISLVESREAAVRADLGRDQGALEIAQKALKREQAPRGGLR